MWARPEEEKVEGEEEERKLEMNTSIVGHLCWPLARPLIVPPVGLVCFNFRPEVCRHSSELEIRPRKSARIVRAVCGGFAHLKAPTFWKVFPLETMTFGRCPAGLFWQLPDANCSKSRGKELVSLSLFLFVWRRE